MGLPKRGNGHDNIAVASTDTHKIWLILGIGLAVVLILFLIFYPTAKQAVFGKAVESEFVYIPPLVFYNFDEALYLGTNQGAGGTDAFCVEPSCPIYVEDETVPRQDIGIGVAQFSVQENDHFTFSHSLLSEDFTIMFWINTQSPGSILSGPGSDSPFIAIQPGSMKLQFQQGSFLLESTAAVPSAWTHYMITRSGTTMTMYENGVVGITSSLDSVLPAEFTIIGSGAAGAFDGRLNNIKLFNAILTAEQFPGEAGIPLHAENNGRVCADKSDNDLDGKIDCADEDCDGLPIAEFTKGVGTACQHGTELTCNDIFDNDGDGARDCADSDCSLFTQCQDAELVCSDGFDNDGDLFVDCADSSCLHQSCGTGCQCTSREIAGAKGITTIYIPSEIACSDGIDNDGDRRADCLDQDCQSATVIDSCVISGVRHEETTAASGVFIAHEDNCANGIDDDKEGGLDCADADCAADAACVAEEIPVVETLCADALDNDGDGASDCTDNDCLGEVGREIGNIAGPRCEEPETSCSDRFDNNGNTLVDCDDSGCAGDAACAAVDTTVPADADGDGVTDTADLCPAGEAGTVYTSGSAPGCLFGDSNGNGCISPGELSVISFGIDVHFHENGCSDTDADPSNNYYFSLAPDDGDVDGDGCVSPDDLTILAYNVDRYFDEACSE